MKPIFVHVGLGRAASSFFQNKVWEEHSGIKHYFRHKHSPHHPEKKYSDQIRRLSPNVINWDKIQEHLSIDENNVPEDKVPLVSYEGWSHPSGVDGDRRARRVKKLYPNAKIIFIIRNQLSRLKSFYATACQKGLSKYNMKSFPSLENWALRAPQEAPVDSIIGWLNPIKALTIDCLEDYYEVFGKDRLCVLPMEAIQDNPQFFADRIGGFMGVDPSEIRKLLKSKPVRKNTHQDKLLIRTKNPFEGIYKILSKFDIYPEKEYN